MSFSYDVLNEEEAKRAREFPLLPDGIYDFAVMENTFGYSQSGNPMIKLKLRIIHDGQEFGVYDNLIGIKSMIWKTKHFCDTTGLAAEYQAGKFDEHMPANRRGQCQIATVPERPKNDGSGGVWKAKNEVTAYISPDKLTATPATFATKPNAFAPAAAVQAPAPIEPEPFLSDDIPF